MKTLDEILQARNDEIKESVQALFALEGIDNKALCNLIMNNVEFFNIKAKQEIIDWVDKEIIGKEKTKSFIETAGLDSGKFTYYSGVVDGHNWLIEEQRKKLKEKI